MTQGIGHGYVPERWSGGEREEGEIEEEKGRERGERERRGEGRGGGERIEEKREKGEEGIKDVKRVSK